MSRTAGDLVRIFNNLFDVREIAKRSHILIALSSQRHKDLPIKERLIDCYDFMYEF